MHRVDGAHGQTHCEEPCEDEHSYGKHSSKHGDEMIMAGQPRHQEPHQSSDDQQRIGEQCEIYGAKRGHCDTLSEQIATKAD